MEQVFFLLLQERIYKGTLCIDFMQKGERSAGGADLFLMNAASLLWK